MRSNSNWVALFLLLGAGALLWAGCQTAYPTNYLSTLGASVSKVIDFETPLSSPQTVALVQSVSGPVTDTAGGSVTTFIINSTLAEVNKPGNQVVTPGTVVPTGSPLVAPLVVGPGANNTAYCVHMAGTVVDPGNGSYPAILMSIPLEASGNKYYDASLFTGIKFYIKVMPGDTASTRSFAIPIAKTTVASSGGICDTSVTPNACYNNFAYAYPNTGGSWISLTLPFNSLTRGNYGANLTPKTLSGENLQQVLALQWSEGNQNVAATVAVDFYVDEIQFY